MNAVTKIERVKIPPKEQTLKKLAQLGIHFPKGAYITAEHAWYMYCKKTGHGQKQETDEEIDARLRRRFRTMDKLVEMAVNSQTRAIIVSGAPGLGKSFNIERRLMEYDPTETKFAIVRGFTTVINLYKALYENRKEGNILVLDDCDAVRKVEEGMNLIKAATDTLDRRIVSYLSEGIKISEKEGGRIPNQFEFQGTLIFITNEDMDSMASDDSIMAQHVNALMNRGHYCDLTLRTRREALIRIKQVIDQGLLSDMPESARADLMKYVEKHKDHFRDLSLRTVIKISQFWHSHPDEWQEMSHDTLIRMR